MLATPRVAPSRSPRRAARQPVIDELNIVLIAPRCHLRDEIGGQPAAPVRADGANTIDVELPGLQTGRGRLQMFLPLSCKVHPLI